MMHSRSGIAHHALWTLVAGVLLATPARAGIDFGSPVNCWLEPETSRTLALQFTTDAELPVLPPAIAFSLIDCTGTTVSTGTVPIGPAGEAALPLNLPRGYYQLVFAAPNHAFGLGVYPPPPTEPDPFFCIDAALSWLVAPADQAGMIAVMKRVGIALARERLSWAQVNPAEAVFDPVQLAHYDFTRAAYRAARLPILEMYHDSPAWAGRAPGDRLPTNALAVRDGVEEFAGRWGAGWAALEAWNEPDHPPFSGGAPAGQYAAFLEAQAAAFELIGTTVPLVGGVLTAIESPVYRETLAANGFFEHIDALSFHTYLPAVALERLAARYRDWAAANDRPALPIWISECGHAWPSAGSRPQAADALASAREIAMKAVEARACGIARYLPFVLAWYIEGVANHSMTSQDGAPLLSLAAYAHALRRLAGSEYIGDLTPTPAGVERARVFRSTSPERYTLVLFRDAPTSAPAVDPGFEPLAIHGIDGRQLAWDPVAGVPLDDGLAYLDVDASMLQGRLTADTEAMRLTTLAAGVDRAPRAPEILIQPRVDTATSRFNAEGYTLTAAAQGRLSFAVRLANPGGVAQSFDLLTYPPTARRRITLAAGEQTDVDCTIDFSESLALGEHRLVRLRVLPVGASEEVSPAALCVAREGLLADWLAQEPDALPIAILPVDQWTTGIGANGQMTLEETVEATWRLEATWTEGDRWVYPRMTLPAEVDLAEGSGLLIRARATTGSTPRIILWEDATPEYGYYTSTGFMIADGAWHTVRLPFSAFTILPNAAEPDGELNPEQVRDIAIGMNADVDSAAIEVSDLFRLGPRAPARTPALADQADRILMKRPDGYGPFASLDAFDADFVPPGTPPNIGVFVQDDTLPTSWILWSFIEATGLYRINDKRSNSGDLIYPGAPCTLNISDPIGPDGDPSTFSFSLHDTDGLDYGDPNPQLGRVVTLVASDGTTVGTEEIMLFTQVTMPTTGARRAPLFGAPGP